MRFQDSHLATTAAYPNISRVDILGVLRTGVNSTVYVGVDRDRKRKVAVKCSGFGLSRRRRTELLMEARLLGRLRHPCIPRVFAHGSTGNSVYVVMDYVKGRTLEELAGQGVVFDAETTTLVMGSVLDALVYLHGRVPPVVHMDLSPSNIMLDVKNRRVMLIDFGAAAAGAAVKPFTEGFASVERMGNAPPHPAMDIFAAGAVLRYLTGNEAGAHRRVATLALRMMDAAPVRRPSAAMCLASLRGGRASGLSGLTLGLILFTVSIALATLVAVGLYLAWLVAG